MQVSRGIRTVEDIIDNQDIQYDIDGGSITSPITQPAQKKRYVPLVGNLINNLTNNNTPMIPGLDSEVKFNNITNSNDTVYYQMNTKNESFLNIHYYLKARGISNNRFHMVLYDKDLVNIDPFDLNLPPYMKQKIFVECQRNFFYYIREVVRVQNQGGAPVRYKLDRGNLALNFCFMLNLNIYEEQPRQTGKTVGTEVWYSWVYNFGSRNGSMIFLNKKHDDAKRNLGDVKQLLEMLPSYLRFDQAFGIDGKKLKAKNTVQYVQHKINFNKIEAIPMATNRSSAISLLRGRTITNCWLDESAFFRFLEESLQNAMPALSRAFANCKLNGAPHGLCLTSTPGFLSTEEGRYMYDLKCNMTPFSELWYDKSLQELSDIIASNEKSIFVYIRSTYQQLGYSEAWLKERIKEQNQKWTDIRREFLLEWATSAENCPFNQEQLRNVARFVKQPKKQIYIGNYLFNLYEEYSPRIIPIIGVDVAAGYSRDSSAISCIDSTTTKLFADFNCNYINPVELSKVIYQLVTCNMPNALVVVERNGVGTGCLSGLMKSRIKHNLYYEVKERVIEEQLGGGRRTGGKRKQWTRVYGLDNTKNVREELMDLLMDRVENHYDKFISPIISEELKSLEVKKTGKIDHSSNSHDDGTFSYLLALYPLYYGKNVKENWNINIPTLTTAQDDAEEIFQNFEATEGFNISDSLEVETNDLIKEQLEQLNNNSKLYKDFILEQHAENENAMREILSTKLGRNAYASTFNVPIESLEEDNNRYDMLPSIDGFYSENNDRYYN